MIREGQGGARRRRSFVIAERSRILFKGSKGPAHHLAQPWRQPKISDSERALRALLRRGDPAVHFPEAGLLHGPLYDEDDAVSYLLSPDL